MYVLDIRHFYLLIFVIRVQNQLRRLSRIACTSLQVHMWLIDVLIDSTEKERMKQFFRNITHKTGWKSYDLKTKNKAWGINMFEKLEV